MNYKKHFLSVVVSLVIITLDFASTKSILKTVNLELNLFLSKDCSVTAKNRLQMYSESLGIFHLVKFISTQAQRWSRSIAIYNFKLSCVCFINIVERGAFGTAEK